MRKTVSKSRRKRRAQATTSKKATGATRTIMTSSKTGRFTKAEIRAAVRAVLNSEKR